MPLRLDIKKRLSAHSDRVKCVDFHPTEPWVLGALYSGNVYIWDYSTQTLIKQFEVCNNLPVRCARFVARKQWIITASDEMMIGVYNYNSLERLKNVEAHSDYIRYIAVHPTSPYVLSCSDDMTIKLWDWDRKWDCVSIFEGHAHYVMMVQWNPKDGHIFASASLDRTIKVWGTTGGTAPHFTLSGHTKGINCLDYSPTGDKPYLVSGADDKTVRVWDYQTKQCVQVLSGHQHNVGTVMFHPTFPIIFSGSEDGTVRLWHSSTYRLEATLNYLLERAWSLNSLKGSNNVAIGYDLGTIVIKLGSDQPVVSMTSNGKIVWAKGHEIQTANVKLAQQEDTSDGERLNLAVKDMGAAEIFPQSLVHNPNSRLLVIVGDGEYVVYTAQALRNKAFGACTEFVWSWDGNAYATNDAIGKITVFHDFVEKFSFKPPFQVEEIFGGRLLGIKSSEYICFYDWQQFKLIRRIDIGPKFVYWNEAGTYVALVCNDSSFVLSHSNEAIATGTADEDGIEAAFDFHSEIGDKITSGLWIGETFVYVNAGQRLQMVVSGRQENIAHLDKSYFMLGYLAENSRVYLLDRDRNVISYSIPAALIAYQSCIINKDFDGSQKYFLQLPESYHTKVARFLQHQGYPEEALKVSKDRDHQLDLALELGKLHFARDVIAASQLESTSTETAIKGKWKSLGDTALENGDFELATECFQKSKDLSALLLIQSSSGDAAGLRATAAEARATGKANIAFLANMLLQDIDACLEIFLETNRLPDAAFFARTYCPSKIPEVVSLWKEDLRTVNEKLSASIAHPEEFPDLFPEYAHQKTAEQILRKVPFSTLPASQYTSVKEKTKDINVLDQIAKQGGATFAKAWSEDILGLKPTTPSAAAAKPAPITTNGTSSSSSTATKAAPTPKASKDGAAPTTGAPAPSGTTAATPTAAAARVSSSSTTPTAGAATSSSKNSTSGGTTGVLPPTTATPTSAGGGTASATVSTTPAPVVLADTTKQDFKPPTRASGDKKSESPSTDSKEGSYEIIQDSGDMPNEP
ncbi:unnamed protein product [Amoebophrya sp. A120]|nr:unnamed protein product [Amoebophrya sp. A120]|eukprot:GSA120T00002240001.1